MAIVVLTVIAAAVGGSLWYQYWKTRRASDFWGHDRASLILNAPTAEVWRLQPTAGIAPANAERISVGGRQFVVSRRVDAAQLKGFVHLRSALVYDASYDWDAPDDDGRGDWKYAIRFADDSSAAIIVLDVECTRVGLASDDQTLALTTHVSKGLRAFLADNIAERQ